MQNKIYSTFLAVLTLMLSSMVNMSKSESHLSVFTNLSSTTQVGNIHIGFSTSLPTNTGGTSGPPSSGLAASPITSIEVLKGESSNLLHQDHIPIANYSINASRNLYVGTSGITSGGADAAKPNGGEFKIQVNTARKEYLGIQQYLLNSNFIPYARITVRDINNKVSEEYFLKGIRINSISTGAYDVSSGQIEYTLTMVYQAIKHVNYRYNSSATIIQVTESMYNYTLNTATF